VRITANLPKWVVDELDRLADETGTRMDEVLKEILEHVLNDEDLVNEIFPEEED
jgi:predicted DNA-binding protein